LGGGLIATAGISHPGLLDERFGLIAMIRGELRSVGVQLAVCAAVFAATVIACRHHGGGIVEAHLGDTLRGLGTVGNYFRFVPVSSSPLLPAGANVPVPVGWNLPAILALGVLIAPGWRDAPALVTRGLLAVLLPLVALAIFFGQWSELRDYLEATPLLLMATYAGVRRIWSVAGSPN